MGDALKKPLKAATFGILGSSLIPSAPKAPAPVEMPDPLNQGLARKRVAAAAMARSGRDSTILTGGDKLGPG